MAQTQFNCKKCRRLIGIDAPQCPFCGTPNAHYNKPLQKTSSVPTAERSLQKPQTETMQDNRSSKAEISVEEMADMYQGPIAVQAAPREAPHPEQVTKAQDPQPTVSEPALHTQDTSTISSAQESHRSKIAWDDERTMDQPETYTEMFNEKGQYQANYDGYYNDTLPKIKDEIDRALAGKEKAILKGIFSILGIIAIIVFLVLTN